MSKRKHKGRDSKSAKRIPTLTETVVILPQTIESLLEAEVAAHAASRADAPATAQAEQAAPGDSDSEAPRPASQPAWPNEQAMEELRSNLTTQTIDLASQLLHGAVREMEAALLEQVLDRLREKLPSLIDDVLNEQLVANSGQAEESNS